MNPTLKTALFFSLIGQIASQETFPTKGLVACYPLDGDVKDLSENEKHGENKGAVTASNRFGKSESSFHFDGKKQHLTLPINVNTDKFPKLTITCWIRLSEDFKLSSYRKSSYLIGHDNNVFNRGLVYRFRSGWVNNRRESTIGPAANAGTNGSLAFNEGINHEWTFLAVTYIENSVEFRINGGAPIRSENFTYKKPGQPTLTVGNKLSGSDRGFHGFIDDIFIYDRVLSEAEIEAVHLKGASWIQSQKKTEIRRELTDKKGRKIHALVIYHDTKTVKIRKGEKEIEISMANLSKEDQKFFLQKSKPKTAIIPIKNDNCLVDEHGKILKNFGDQKSVKTVHLPSLNKPDLSHLIIVENKSEKFYYKPDGSIFLKGSPEMKIRVNNNTGTQKTIYITDKGLSKLIDLDRNLIHQSTNGVPFWKAQLYNKAGSPDGYAIIENHKTHSVFNHPDGRKVKIFGWICHDFATPDGISVYKGGKYALIGFDGKLLIPPLYAEPLKYLGNGNYEAEVNGGSKTITLK